MYCDIVLLPPQPIRERVGRVVRTAARGRAAVYAADNRSLIPHLSLFHIRLPKARLPKLAAAVERVVERYRAQPIRSRGAYLRASGSVSLRLSKPRPLVLLHRELVRTCRGFRSGEMPWTSKSTPTARERQYRHRYGTQHVMKFFDPHLTLGQFRDTADAKVLARHASSLKLSFFGDTVAIGEVNYWHQVTRMLQTFRLKRG